MRGWFKGHPVPGDILFVCKRSPGQVCLAPEPVKFCIAQDMVAVRADPSKVYPPYLFAALRSSTVQDQIANMHVGTMIPHFKKGDFNKLHIPFPGRPIQTAIGDLYLELSRKIELNWRMNETLEASARALFRDWFVDFGPTCARAEGCSAYLAPDLWSLFPDRLDDAGVPKGWLSQRLTKFFDIVGGGTPKTDTPGFWGGDIPWFSVVDTPAAGSAFVVDTQKTITQAGLVRSSARLVNTGTTIVSARGTVGNLAIVARPMAFNQSCYALIGRKGFGTTFVFLAAQNMVSRLKAMSHGSVFSTITRDTFNSLAMTRPSAALSVAFEAIASGMFNQIMANVLQSRTLAETRDMLLPKLMSGAIRVREAEDAVAALC